MTALLPEGLRDRLPPQAEATARLVTTLLATIASHGYERVQPPLVEFEESLAGTVGNDRRDLLRFVDPVTQRTLALRPDITGQVGRIAATRLAHSPRPLRLSYAGPVLRVKGDQLTPERERLQLGAELIGSDGIAAVTEVLRLAVEALTGAGLTGISIDLTLPDIVETLASQVLPPARIDQLKALLDMKDAGGMAGEGFADWLPLTAATGDIAAALPALRAFDHAGLLASRLDGIEALAAALTGVRLTLDPTERHGFEYQSWIGFSIFADGVRGEVGRGGSYRVRHDEGGEAAVGFSLYVDGLVDAGLGVVEARRVWIPLDAPADAAARSRAEGWVSVAALTVADTPRACSYIWTSGGIVPLEESFDD